MIAEDLSDIRSELDYERLGGFEPLRTHDEVIELDPLAAIAGLRAMIEDDEEHEPEEALSLLEDLERWVTRRMP